MPSRRSLLGSLGVLLTAGCSQQSQADTQAPADTPTTTSASSTSDPIHVPTQLPWGESTTYDGTTVTPTAAVGQHSVITLPTPDSFGVESFTAKQLLFVVVGVEGSDPRPSPDDFTLDAAGERYTGWTSLQDLPPHRFRLDNHQTSYDPSDDVPGGWIGFRLPAEVDATNPKLRLQFAGENEGATRWPLPEDAATALRSPAPHSHIDKLEVPESVPADDSFDVTITARNDGKGAGVFRAAVNEAGPQYAPHAVRLPLEPGESSTTSVTTSGHIGTGADHATVDIVTQDRDISRTVTLE